MAWTAEDVAALEAAIRGGAVIEEMEIGGQRFKFRSLSDMQGLLAQMKQAVDPTSYPTTRVASISKGFAVVVAVLLPLCMWGC